jgi:hypothetical protein
MPFTVAGIIRLLTAVGPITAALPQFKEVFDGIVGTFKNHDDQATLQAAYRELQNENSGGHVRLQEMLRKAALEE